MEKTKNTDLKIGSVWIPSHRSSISLSFLFCAKETLDLQAIVNIKSFMSPGKKITPTRCHTKQGWFCGTHPIFYLQGCNSIWMDTVMVPYPLGSGFWLDGYTSQCTGWQRVRGFKDLYLSPQVGWANCSMDWYSKPHLGHSLPPWAENKCNTRSCGPSLCSTKAV